MPLPEHWATPEDFATLFQYMWHRDFPMDESATGAKRTDWTIHIGVAVRSMADMMGLAARFERGGRKDAILRSLDGDEIAVEWEWEGVWKANELSKLKRHRVWSSDGKKVRLRFAVLITYTHTPNVQKVLEHVRSEWQKADWPLLLILIDLKESKRFHMGKEFNKIRMSVFDTGTQRALRVAPAFPWKVERSRWSVQRL